MRLLNLANGEFQVFSMPHGKYDMVYKTPNGYLQAVTGSK